MFKQISILVITMSLNSFVNAGVTLTTQQEIKIEEINGQSISKKILSSNSNKYQLNQGVSDLEVSYYQYFDAENGIGAHDIVRSAPVKIKTPILKDNETYSLALIQPPKTNEQAKAFAKQPIFGLYNSKNELLMTQKGAFSEQKGVISAIFGDQNIKTKNEEDKKQQENAIYTENAEVPDKNTLQQTQFTKDALNQLMIAWKNANQDDRQKFMVWLADQTN